MKKPYLIQKYNNEIIPEMMKKFGCKNKFQVPRMKAIVINMGLGGGSKEFKIIEKAISELSQIVGQTPVVTRAQKAISNFKIRKGDPVGCRVTLRGNRMYEFLNRLIDTAIPRIKDFRGINGKSFDNSYNFTMGVREHTIFPEIEYDKVDKVLGMNITFVMASKSRDESYELLKLFGIPFKND